MKQTNKLYKKMNCDIKESSFPEDDHTPNRSDNLQKLALRTNGLFPKAGTYTKQIAH